MTKLKCSNCNHVWEPRVDNPKRCPNCGISKRYGNFEKVGD